MFGLRCVGSVGSFAYWNIGLLCWKADQHHYLEKNVLEMVSLPKDKLMKRADDIRATMPQKLLPIFQDLEQRATAAEVKNFLRYILHLDNKLVVATVGLGAGGVAAGAPASASGSQPGLGSTSAVVSDCHEGCLVRLQGDLPTNWSAGQLLVA